MQAREVELDEELIAGKMYICYYGSKRFAGIYKPGRGNEELYPSFDVNGKLFSVRREDVREKVINNA